MRNNLFSITSSLEGSNNESNHTSLLSSTASYRGVNPTFSNNNLEKYASGFSRSHKSFANELDTHQEHINGQT